MLGTVQGDYYPKEDVLMNISYPDYFEVEATEESNDIVIMDLLRFSS